MLARIVHGWSHKSLVMLVGRNLVIWPIAWNVRLRLKLQVIVGLLCQDIDGGISLLFICKFDIWVIK